MTRRRHLAIALPVAAFKDTVALVSAATRLIVLDPLLCGLVGHHWHVWNNQDTAQVLQVCDRCPKVVPGAR